MIIMKEAKPAMDARHSKFLATFLMAITVCLHLQCARAADAPHIVYIVADDLGWKDVGFHGGEANTPNLDALADSGARLERFYTLPNSTPTLAAVMTGRYPQEEGSRTVTWNARWGPTLALLVRQPAFCVEFFFHPEEGFESHEAVTARLMSLADP